MRKSIICATAIGAVFFMTVFAADQEQWTGGVRDGFPQGYHHEGKALAKTATYTYSARGRLINGRVKNRVNLAYAGDGWAVADTARFPQWADSNMNYRRGLTNLPNNKLAMRPFLRYDKFINWYVINVVSPQSGVSNTTAYGQPNTTTVNNALGGTVDAAGGGRIGWVDDSKAADLFHQAAATLGIDSIHWHYVVLNYNGYNNSGDYNGPCVYSYPNWGDIAVHESGHAFHVFTDEYWSCSGSNTAEGIEVNATATVNSTKWVKWAGYVDADPKLGQDPGWGCDVAGAAAMGFYVGCNYVQNGQYRPTPNSKMDGTSQQSPTSWNAVCREKIVHDIYARVRPIDTLFDTTGTKTNPDSLWVRVIDTNVLKVDWYVGTTLKKSNGGISFKKSDISGTVGTFTVRAHVYDAIIRHMNGSNTTPDTLDIVRQDTSRLFQDAQWTVQLTTATMPFNEIQKEVFRADVVKNTIVYGLQREGEAAIDIFRVDGSLVKRLKVYGSAGRNVATIAGVPSGMYLVSLRCADGAQVMRMNYTK